MNKTKPIKIAPTSDHLYEFIAKINGAPIPPAPTNPSTARPRISAIYPYSTFIAPELMLIAPK